MKFLTLALLVAIGASAFGEPAPRPHPTAIGFDAAEDAPRLEFSHLLGDGAFTHSDSVTHVQPLSAGRLLTASEDGSARIWDTESGREISRFAYGDEELWNAIPLPDGKLATASDTLCIWDIKSGEQLRCLEQKDEAYRLTAIPDTTHVASGHDGKTILIRDWETGATIRELTFIDNEVYSLAAPSSDRLITVGDDGAIQLWDLTTGKSIRSITGVIVSGTSVSRPRVSTVSLSPDRKRVLISVGAMLLCLRAEDLGSVWMIPLDNTSYVNVWSPDGNRAALCSGRSLLVIDTESGEKIFDADIPHRGRCPIAYSLNGKEIITGGDRTIFRFDATDGSQIYPPADHRQPQGIAGATTFSADGLKVLLGSSDGFVYPFETISGKALPPWETGDSGDFLGRSPTGEIFAAEDNGKVTRFAAEADGTIEDNYTVGSFDDLDVAANGMLITESNDGIKRWLDGKMIDFLGGEDSSFQSVSASLDGELVATSAEGVDDLRIWDTQSGVLVRKITSTVGSPDAVYMFPNGRGLALLDDEDLYLWFEPNPKPLPAHAEAELERLLALLSDNDFQTRMQACRALIDFGTGAIPLLETRRSKSPEVMLQLAQALQQLRDQLGGDLILAQSFDKDLTSFVASPDGKHWAATAGEGHRTRLVFGRYDRDATFEVLQQFSSPNSACQVAFSPDGSHLVTGNSSATLSLYRVVLPGE